MTRDSLSHTEVIYIAADFLQTKPLMQKILVKKFPILLIDESQDTKKELIDAFFAVQAQNIDKFSLGLFGDIMQRIYSDGKQGLGENLPTDWVKPEKKMNYRCPVRVVELINRIRMNGDGKQQIVAPTKEDGVVRLFIVGPSERSKPEIEREISEKMSRITGDALWADDVQDVKFLTLEHHMAAVRLRFLDLFRPLYNCEGTSTGLLDGTLSSMRLFTEQVLPLINAKKGNDNFLVADIVKKHSPLLDTEVLRNSQDQRKQLQNTNIAVSSLYELWKDGEPKLIDIILNLADTKLFDLPFPFDVIANRKQEDFLPEDGEERQKDIISAWDDALNSTFDQIASYKLYISGTGKFGTHQGVKGLQFPRVMVIVDDEEARGFMFSYGKIFGDKELTKADRDNAAAGKETSVDRTTRLFYVACSRAEKSLAVVAYSATPDAVKQHTLKQDWFKEEEIEII